MAILNNQSENIGRGGGRYRLELVGLTSVADRPEITIQAIDAKNETLSAQKG